MEWNGLEHCTRAVNACGENLYQKWPTGGSARAICNAIIMITGEPIWFEYDMLWLWLWLCFSSFFYHSAWIFKLLFACKPHVGRAPLMNTITATAILLKQTQLKIGFISIIHDCIVCSDELLIEYAAKRRLLNCFSCWNSNLFLSLLRMSLTFFSSSNINIPGSNTFFHWKNGNSFKF